MITCDGCKRRVLMGWWVEGRTLCVDCRPASVHHQLYGQGRDADHPLMGWNEVPSTVPNYD